MKDGSMYFSGSLGQGQDCDLPERIQGKGFTDPDYKMYLAQSRRRTKVLLNRAPETDIF